MCCPLTIGCDARGAASAEVRAFSRKDVSAATVEVERAVVLDFRCWFLVGVDYVGVVVLVGG